MTDISRQTFLQYFLTKVCLHVVFEVSGRIVFTETRRQVAIAERFRELERGARYNSS
jgi:hypothetical protein